jgi:hypothetical protein
MARQCTAFGILMLAAQVGATSEQAEKARPDDRVLRGLMAVSFWTPVDGTGPARPVDVAHQIVKARLEAEGVPVTARSATVPELGLDCLVMTQQGEGSFTMSLQLFERVRLVRQPAVVLRAPTWSSSAADTGGDPLHQRLEKAARKLADDFARAWKRTH